MRIQRYKYIHVLFEGLCDHFKGMSQISFNNRMTSYGKFQSAAISMDRVHATWMMSRFKISLRIAISLFLLRNCRF